MTESITELGHASTPEVQPPEVTPEVTLIPGEPVSLGEQRPVDEVGSIDWVAFAEKERLKKEARATKKTRLKNGFAAYRDAGGRFSESLHRSLIAGVERLREPGEREKSKLHAPTIGQAEGFVYRHNNPLGPQGPLPPEQQIALSQEQIDAYCLLRENRVGIPEEDRQNGANPAQFSDVPLIREILKMPLLKPQEVQPQAFPAAA